MKHFFFRSCIKNIQAFFSKASGIGEHFTNLFLRLNLCSIEQKSSASPTLCKTSLKMLKLYRKLKKCYNILFPQMKVKTKKKEMV